MQAVRQIRPADLDLVRIAEVGNSLRQLRDELMKIFPEREHLINQIMYALLTREHVLIFGTFGTGKSDLVTTIFESIVGDVTFSIALSKFMTEANLIGIPNPRTMREEGRVEYPREGGILDADFAELDELFDANAPLLRVLLGILNERNFKRGRQYEKAKLHSAIASTNGDPTEMVKRDPSLAAVVDRFIFQARVQYLQTPDSRREMFLKYLSGAKPTVSISLDDLKYVSGVVVDANQISDLDVLDAYDKIIEGYRVATKVVISDRRRCKLLQIVEAEALSFGRFDVVEEDLDAVRWGLCLAGDKAQHDAFTAVAKPIIAAAMQARQQNVDGAALQLLEKIKAQLPKKPTKNMSVEQLGNLSKDLNSVKTELMSIKPQLASTLDLKKKIEASVEERLAKTLEMIQLPVPTTTPQA